MPSSLGCRPRLTLCPQVHSLQELRRSASLATKVFVQRDYSDGTTCQFQTKFPPELESRVGSLRGCQGGRGGYPMGTQGEEGSKDVGTYGVLYGPGPASAAGCVQSQLSRLVCKGFGAPGDWEALLKAAGTAGLGTGGRCTGVYKLKHQLGREERVKCSPSPPRKGDKVVQGVSPWPDSSSPCFLS